MKIDNEILNILDNCTFAIGKRNVVYLPLGELDIKIRLATNKCLEEIGGKWDKKEKGYIFKDYPIDLFKNLRKQNNNKS